MSEKLTTTPSEMLEALTRSGYLLEAEVAKFLSQYGFFVESSQVIKDQITGKSREIDIVAEYYDREKSYDGIKGCAKIEFVFEIKNNIFPVVLLNEFESTPRKEDYLGLKEFITMPEGINDSCVDEYYELLITNTKPRIFSQYCSFQKKKQNDELMALHPENIHDGISKIVQYCEEEHEGWIGLEEQENYKHDYFRKFLYMPVLLLNDELYELSGDKLEKVTSSVLVINYHYKSEKKMAFVFVVTKNGLHSFIDKALEIEKRIEFSMKKAIKNV